ncbi:MULTISPECIES: hypothetical protein [unclassified Caballeronia]|uniref:hypothetical protein n=1 Tax=unclassified Caballeronia TaxID=2646786 RepID=UPI001F1BE972|nr:MULTISPECIES: hypothetical protein [unclassified Caballeronia]MCE4544618.1 hypothetical protein [Caballeronia sp. PC1]MCE4571770.1 hypothetical protein [Caballeronia sp. CLC5]
MQIMYFSGPTPQPLTTFLTDDFGDELCTIPGEHCRTNAEDMFEVLVNPNAWGYLVALGVRDSE